MSASENLSPPIVNTRHFAAPPTAVFAAFADPQVLAKWWGPAGFTNTVHEYDFRPGGTWKLTMHGPDGTDYPNESRFVTIVPPERLVYEHLGPMHWYRLAMTFSPEGAGTRLTWDMRFSTIEEYEKVREFVVPANEQNFDRLEAVLRQTGELP